MRVTEKVIRELHDFYGQEVYSGVEGAISRRSAKALFFFKVMKIFKNNAFFNFLLISIVVFFYNVFRYPESGKEGFFYGVTKNNERAFDKLYACLSEEFKNKISRGQRRASFRKRFLTVINIPSVWEVAVALSREKIESPLVAFRAAVGGAACLLYSTFPLPKSVRVLCVASDHSPVARALIALCHSKGVRTCYVQHAPVTKHFPPLSTELSVLYDEESVKAYRLAAERCGQKFSAWVELMPPFAEPFKTPSIGDGPYIVGICLSRFPNISKIEDVINFLSESGRVSKIFLRTHPACQLDFSSLLQCEMVVTRAKEESLAYFSSLIDVALVPNSGVAIELLHSGVPTFYVDGSDDLPSDYYGFVSLGVLPLFEGRVIFDKERVNSFYNDAWASVFSKYDVTVYKTIQSCRAKVKESFESLFG
ncbi:hypothetical protein [Chromohalobacter israelensis]|uniref:hypothetical protein n=1 Tax=Chromohalobacter israelensis TaxID=141390 RepID=UPI000FFEEA48|nr:hypothetical protein [Chromohalobacter salexigens]